MLELRCTIVSKNFVLVPWLVKKAFAEFPGVLYRFNFSVNF
jgi:hypothetical protein